MTETSPAREGRSRPWWVNALAGGWLVLALLMAADAALPRIAPHAGPDPPRASREPPPPLAPAAPPALIAFQTPAPGYPVISPFGLRQLPWDEGGRLHAGVDIAAPAGRPVLAAADGVVTRIAVDPGYGRFVELKHAAGLSTRYAHLGRVLPWITPGAAVKAGAAVGEMGSTGTSTGAHLHFEVRDDRGRPLNPELFIGRRFATTGDLPLGAAARIPRQVRVAYVSNIPRAKREEMALAAADAGVAAGAQADDAGAADAAPRIGLVQGRPHARFKIRN